MNVIECEQGTELWRQIRAGKVTASRMNDVLATIKTGEAATRRNYRSQVLSEMMSGQPCENGYVSEAMKFGSEQEPFARAAYEIARDVTVDQVGFVIHPTIEFGGCSPDGLVGTEGMIQVKVPNTATHIDYILAGEVPSDYKNQMLFEMACAGRQWSDFVSYDPRLPAHFQLFVRRFPRDDKRIVEIEAAVVQFLSEVNETITKLKDAVMR